MLCKAPSSVKGPLDIGKWQDYKICNQKGTVAEVTTWNDEKEFADMHEALIKLGFSEEQACRVHQKQQRHGGSSGGGGCGGSRSSSSVVTFQTLTLPALTVAH